ncbi:FMN-binding split barrel-related [Rhypophila sp. PSN 637]
MEESYSYPVEARNTVHRHRERAKYDYETVHGIVDASSILHVSFLPTDPENDPYPTILPMIGSMGSFQGESSVAAQDLYLHGHSASRIMRLAGGGGSDGIPVCVAATQLDGIKLSLTPFNNSCNYRSAVLHGDADVVTDEAEKDFALRLITNGLVPGCWDNQRVPPTRSENLSTSVLRVRIATASAKINQGGPADDRKDLQNDEVTGKVWTGTLPVWECVGTPIASATNKIAKVPDYVLRKQQKQNAENEKYARDAVSVTKEKK